MNMRLKMMRRQKWVIAGVAVLAMMSSVVLVATNFQLVQVNSSNIEKNVWASPSVSWVMNPTNTIVYIAGTSTAGTTLAAASDLSTLLGNAFNLWSGATYQSTLANGLSFTEGANSTANSQFNSNDCVNTIGFTQNLGSSIIGETQVTHITTGTPGSPIGAYNISSACQGTCPYQVCIIDADVEFNSGFNFYTPSYSSPPSSYFDLRTVATHEIGHMIGLDHSGLASAIMFPYGDSGNGGAKSALTLDDLIGSEVLYPNSSSGIESLLGQITGNVSFSGGGGVYAAHLVAYDDTTGNTVTDTLADPNGNYTLVVPAGVYVVALYPLAPDNNHGDTTINNYTGFAGGYPSATINTNYTGQTH